MIKRLCHCEPRTKVEPSYYIGNVPHRYLWTAGTSRTLVTIPFRCTSTSLIFIHFSHHLSPSSSFPPESRTKAAELRTRPDVVVATPGRLLDHISNSQGVDMDDVEFLVLDEADRLLDLGFQDEVHEIVKSCPAERQTMLFSATQVRAFD